MLVYSFLSFALVFLVNMCIHGSFHTLDASVYEESRLRNRSDEVMSDHRKKNNL